MSVATILPVAAHMTAHRHGALVAYRRGLLIVRDVRVAGVNVSLLANLALPVLLVSALAIDVTCSVVRVLAELLLTVVMLLADLTMFLLLLLVVALLSLALAVLLVLSVLGRA